MFDFNITSKINTLIRTGELTTPHGTLKTPNLAIVATNGEIRGIPKKIIKNIKLDLTIVNTFHLYTKGIVEKIKPKTIHNYSGMGNPTMSDSGGFQVFSMGFGKSHQVGKIGGMFPGKKYKNLDTNNSVEINENGVTFKYDNKKLQLTPKKSIMIQEQIGADIIFAFDECTSPLNSKTYTRQAMERTHRWVMRCLKTKKNNKQALFAIVQGGYFEDLRIKSASFMSKLDVPGFGIGGSLGKTKKEMLQILEWTIPLLPENKPRHLLGIGQVMDIFEGIERGVDTFDCVIPTREARHKVIYTKEGKIQLQKMKNKDEVIDRSCSCLSCSSGITWKKLYNYFSDKVPEAFLYSSLHNIYFYKTLMEEIRKSIKENKFFDLKKQYSAYY